MINEIATQYLLNRTDIPTVRSSFFFAPVTQGGYFTLMKIAVIDFGSPDGLLAGGSGMQRSGLVSVIFLKHEAVAE